MSVQPKLVATTQTIATAYGVIAQRVVAIPPSSVDPWPTQIRVRINDFEISRPYDPDSEAAW